MAPDLPDHRGGAQHGDGGTSGTEGGLLAPHPGAETTADPLEAVATGDGLEQQLEAGLVVPGGRHRARSAVEGTTHGWETYASSLAGADVTPSRCSLSAVPIASAPGSSTRRRPDSASTCSWDNELSQPSVTSPMTRPETASSTAEARSSTCRNCHRGLDPRTTSNRGASKCRLTRLGSPDPPASPAAAR